MRSTKRAWASSELPPLLVDDVSARKSQRRTQAPVRQTRSAGPGPRVVPKVYPRLQTLAQLTNNYVRDLHVGNVIARSEARWKSFDGLDAPNSARNLAYDVVQQSAALVIQCAWRKHVAIEELKRLKVVVWRHQLDVAATITRHTTSLTRALRLMETIKPERHRLAVVSSILSTYGIYFHAPARLLTWWLSYTSAKLRGKRILRHPPTVVASMNIPVALACRKLARLWHGLVLIAALTIQCGVRAFLAGRVVGKRRLERLRHEAAVILQGFIRVYNAKYMVRRFKRRCAAVRIQCRWRCVLAKNCLQQRRITWAVTSVCTPLIKQAARQATVKLRIASARIIQKYFRGSRARAQVRELLSRNEQLKWRQNPSKGFAFFEQMRYDRAALYLEYCFRQGIFAGEPLPAVQASPMVQNKEKRTPHRKLVSGSRMSFSFSTAPTKLGNDWILQRDDDRDADNASIDVVRLAGRLQFWQAYAISHFRVFEATGEILNLRQARVGWESYLQVDAVANTWTAFQEPVGISLIRLRLQSQFELVRCLFWGGKQSDKDKALALCIKLLEDFKSHKGERLLNLANAKFIDVVGMEAQLLMISCMIYFEQTRYAICCCQLEKLLILPEQKTYPDVEIRFALALVLLMRYEESFKDIQGARKIDDPEMVTFMRTATQLLKQCYREIELWPSVGFYHGWMKKSDAKRLLEREQIGAFLLHQPIDTIGKRQVHDSSARKILLHVKLQDQPLQISSLWIELTDAGLYKTRKSSAHVGHFSLHGLVASLPSEAGVNMEMGVRKSMYSTPLRKKLRHFQPGEPLEKELLRSLILPWDEWERKLNEIEATYSSGADGRWKRRNETWSAVCFEIAKALECNQAWVFAEIAAREALAHSKTRAHRANVCFLAARITMNMQKRSESALLMQQAHLEKETRQNSTGATHVFIDNLSAVQCALSLNVSISMQEPFVSRLERIQKLERMCLKAWRCNSLTAGFRGDPFSEALLLQRIADETYAECGDTFFTRSLLKAHIRAYLANGSWYEDRHLKCAFACIGRLFERFYKHQDSWTTHLANLAYHFENEVVSKKVGPKRLAFNVKLLLLSWHHIPFLLCFEMAEVLYRYKTHSVSTLIDVYESLLGRIRGSQPRTPVYSSYEELFCFDCRFCTWQKYLKGEHSWRHLDSAVIMVNEILEQRKDRARLFLSMAVKTQAKRIKWPSSIRLPVYLSDAEVLFIRGFFIQIKEDMMRISADRRTSWRDYHSLHQEVMDLVKKYPQPGEASGSGGRMLNSVRHRVENLKGLRIFVGATHDLEIANVLLSQPVVVIRHEGNTTPTRTQPGWTNLSPTWEEDVEIPVSSAKASIVISVMNRTNRNSRWQDVELIGLVSIGMYDLVAARDGVTIGKYYKLAVVKPHNQGLVTGGKEHSDKPARIFLAFQVVLKPHPTLPPSAKQTATWATRSGNWDLEEVRAHLHGDFQAFVANPWIWSRFANMFVEDGDLFIAKWFFLKAVRLTSALKRRTSLVGVRLNSDESLVIAKDLIGLSRCHRVTLGDSCWREQALPLLEQAQVILTRSIVQQDRERGSLSNRAALEHQLAVVQTMATYAGTPSSIGPLEEALSRNTSASSEWVKITSSEPNDGNCVHYFNQDTGETFQSKWRTEPLEHEDKQLVITEEHLPHRIIVMNENMKARVEFHRHEMIRQHDEDPFKWVAVFNDRRKEIQYFSPHLPEAYSSPSASKHPARPPTYVMLADEFLLWHVLLVQDAYRRYRSIRQKRRRLRGLFMSACLFSRELFAARHRVFLGRLNCVRVVIDKAQHLRAADLLTSDPFVELKLTDPTGEVVATGKTSVRYNSLNPQWNEEFHFRYSFVEHNMHQTVASSLGGDKSILREALLTLTVFDYDVVANQKGSNDFLGMVAIPIRTFVHGKCMTADLPLFDEKGEKKSPRSRGLITVSIQWNHCDDEDIVAPNAAKLWAIGSGGGRSLVDMKPKQRPELSDDASHELDILRPQMEQLLQQLHDMGAEVLEPMLRLHKRMQIAQTRGKTADEAKMLEQRMDALLRTQLLPRQQRVRELAVECSSIQLDALLKKLHGPIEEYLASFDYSSRSELRALMEKCSHELNVAVHSLQVAPFEGIKPADAMEMASEQQRQVDVVNEQLRRILDTFFLGDNAKWHFVLEEKVGVIYNRLKGNEGHRQTERQATATAVVNRKERIERAKQEKAWYEL